MLPGATQIADARNAWAPLSWSDIRLRIGPNYKRNKEGADRRAVPSRARRRVDAPGRAKGLWRRDHRRGVPAAGGRRRGGRADATRFHPGQQPCGRTAAVAALPRGHRLHAEVHLRRRRRPNLGFSFVLSVPSRLRTDPDPQAKLLCAFLDGSGNGHTDESGDFYDRFKVIVRCREAGVPIGVFLRKMIDWFNGKPMLWRFFGIWGE